MREQREMRALAPVMFEGTPVRMFIDMVGDFWWVLMDLAVALGIENSRDLCSRLEDDEHGDVDLTDSSGRIQQSQVVNESGLYTVILRCRDATTPGSLAYRFRRWVTKEVLPSIRKTGHYSSVSIPVRESLNRPEGGWGAASDEELMMALQAAIRNQQAILDYKDQLFKMRLEQEEQMMLIEDIRSSQGIDRSYMRSIAGITQHTEERVASIEKDRDEAKQHLHHVDLSTDDLAPKSLRTRCHELVRLYCRSHSLAFDEAWAKAYQELELRGEYRYRVHARLRNSRRKGYSKIKSLLDQVEHDGKMKALYDVLSDMVRGGWPVEVRKTASQQ